MDLNLFSSYAKDGMRNLLGACRPCLEGKEDPLVAYLPAGSLTSAFDDLTKKTFRGLARVAILQTELMTLQEMGTLLREAALVCIPDGNCYLLNHRLHLCKIADYLRKAVAAGLPLVTFSAGTVLCGPNILTSNDPNIVPTSYFRGLEATPFNFNVDYPDDESLQAERDEWLAEYFVFHENPIILMAENAHVRVHGRKTWLAAGDAWVLRHGKDKERLEAGIPISP